MRPYGQWTQGLAAQSPSSPRLVLPQHLHTAIAGFGFKVMGIFLAVVFSESAWCSGYT